MEHTSYPLGHGVFVFVKTYKKCVNINMSRYRVTKKGRVVKAASISLSQKQFQQLLHVKNKVCQDYNKQMSELDKSCQKETESTPKSKKIKLCKQDSAVTSKNIDSHT